MSSCRSFVFTGKEEVSLVDLPCPKPRAGQLLIQTSCTLISTGTESTVYRRNFAAGTHWDQWVKYPFYPGYLNVGRVVEVADGVTGWKVGDRVASRGGHASHVLVDAGAPAAMASVESGDCTPSSQAVAVPDNVSDEQAVWMGLGKIVQVGIRAAEHKLGDDVVVIGLGLLGQLVIQYVRLMGAGRIIAIDTAPARLAMAKVHGADDVLQMTADKALDEVKKLTGGRGADVVYDVTGHPAVLAMALPLARKFGQVVLLGDAGSPHLQTLTPDVITRGVRIVAAHDGHPPMLPNEHVRWSGLEMFQLFMTYLARGQMNVADLITHRFKPEQAKEAYTLLQTHRETAMGVLFQWG